MCYAYLMRPVQSGHGLAVPTAGFSNKDSLLGTTITSSREIKRSYQYQKIITLLEVKQLIVRVKFCNVEL